MLLAVGLLLVQAVGFAAASLVAPSAPASSRLAVAWGLGLGLISLLMFYASWAGMPLTQPYVLALILAVALACYLAGAARTRSANVVNVSQSAPLAIRFRSTVATVRAAVIPPAGLMTVEAAIVLTLALFLAASTLIALYWPVYEADAIATFDFRGRAFFVERTIDLQAYAESTTHLGFAAIYPLLTSLAHTWVYLFGGTNPHVLYPPFYASLVAGFYLLLRDEAPRLRTMVFTLLLASTPLLFEHSTIAYTNLPLTFYYGLGGLYLVRWLATGKRSDGALATLLLALTAWVRPHVEPHFLVALLVALVGTWRCRHPWQVIVGLVVAYLAVEIPWLGYQQVALGLTPGAVGLATSAATVPALPTPGRLAIVLAYLGTHLVTLQAFGPVWILFGLVVLGRLHRNRGGEYLLWLVLLNVGIAAYAGYALVGTAEWSFFLWDGMKRLLMTFVPLALYYVATSRLAEIVFDGLPARVKLTTEGEAS